MNIIFVKHKTKMSTLKRYRVVSPVSRFAPESFRPWVVLPWVVSPVSCFVGRFALIFFNRHVGLS